MNKLLSKYFEQNFFLIPIRQNDKRPVYKKWNRYSLSYNEARGFINGGFNLAVVAKDLWIFDYDKRILPVGPHYRVYNTWIQFTPNGFHVFYRNGDTMKDIRERLPFYAEPDTIRHGDMYALVAPSKVDGHSYWWLDDCKGEILTI